MKNYVSSLAAIAVAGVAAIGCGAGDRAQGDEPVTTLDTQPIVDWETYRASARTIPEVGLIVEYDLLFPSEEALYEHWQKTYAGGPGQALSVHTIDVNGVTVDDIWPFPERFDITYCISNGFTPTQLNALLPALDEATETWSRFLAVGFRRVSVSGTCDRNNPEVHYNVEPATYSATNFPSRPREFRVLWLDSDGMDDAFMVDAYGVDLVGTLLHEFGHILGLVHDHKWNNACPAQPFDTNTSARQVTAYDQMSVTNYPIPGCRNPPGGGYFISPLDVTGTVKLYGLAPALIGTISSFSVAL